MCPHPMGLGPGKVVLTAWGNFGRLTQFPHAGTGMGPSCPTSVVAVVAVLVVTAVAAMAVVVVAAGLAGGRLQRLFLQDAAGIVPHSEGGRASSCTCPEHLLGRKSPWQLCRILVPHGDRARCLCRPPPHRRGCPHGGDGQLVPWEMGGWEGKGSAMGQLLAIDACGSLPVRLQVSGQQQWKVKSGIHPI